MTNSIILRTEEQRHRALEIIGRLNLGKPWKVTIERHTQKRSLQQNAWMHKIFSVVADHTGNSMEDIKLAYKDMFLGKVAVEFGDEVRMVPRSTARLSTQEMSEFTEKIMAHAQSELGIILPAQEAA